MCARPYERPEPQTPNLSDICLICPDWPWSRQQFGHDAGDQVMSCAEPREVSGGLGGPPFGVARRGSPALTQDLFEP